MGDPMQVDETRVSSTRDLKHLFQDEVYGSKDNSIPTDSDDVYFIGVASPDKKNAQSFVDGSAPNINEIDALVDKYAEDFNQGKFMEIRDNHQGGTVMGEVIALFRTADGNMGCVGHMSSLTAYGKKCIYNTIIQYYHSLSAGLGVGEITIHDSIIPHRKIAERFITELSVTNNPVYEGQTYIKYYSSRPSYIIEKLAGLVHNSSIPSVIRIDRLPVSLSLLPSIIYHYLRMGKRFAAPGIEFIDHAERMNQHYSPNDKGGRRAVGLISTFFRLIAESSPSSITTDQRIAMFFVHDVTIKFDQNGSPLLNRLVKTRYNTSSNGEEICDPLIEVTLIPTITTTTTTTTTNNTSLSSQIESNDRESSISPSNPQQKQELPILSSGINLPKPVFPTLIEKVNASFPHSLLLSQQTALPGANLNSNNSNHKEGEQVMAEQTPAQQSGTNVPANGTAAAVAAAASTTTTPLPSLPPVNTNAQQQSTGGSSAVLGATSISQQQQQQPQPQQQQQQQQQQKDQTVLPTPLVHNPAGVQTVSQPDDPNRVTALDPAAATAAVQLSRETLIESLSKLSPEKLQAALQLGEAITRPIEGKTAKEVAVEASLDIKMQREKAALYDKYVAERKTEEERVKQEKEIIDKNQNVAKIIDALDYSMKQNGKDAKDFVTDQRTKDLIDEARKVGSEKVIDMTSRLGEYSLAFTAASKGVLDQSKAEHERKKHAQNRASWLQSVDELAVIVNGDSNRGSSSLSSLPLQRDAPLERNGSSSGGANAQQQQQQQQQLPLLQQDGTAQQSIPQDSNDSSSSFQEQSDNKYSMAKVVVEYFKTVASKLNPHTQNDATMEYFYKSAMELPRLIAGAAGGFQRTNTTIDGMIETDGPGLVSWTNIKPW